MKKNTLILTLASSALALCASVGAFVSSETTTAKANTQPPQLTIAGQNLSFEDNIYILYAVSAKNLATTDDFGLLLWTEPQETYEYSTAKTKLVSNETKTIGGVEYPCFTYSELAAKQMTETVYTRAYAERDGVYYYSDVKKYSILEYAYNLLGKTEKTGTTVEDFKVLLNAMLAYGGAAQTYLKYNLDNLATADFTYVRVENAKFEDGFEYGLFKAGTPVKITPNEGFALGDTHADYYSVNENGEIILTVPEEKTIDESGSFEVAVPIGTTLTVDNCTYTVTAPNEVQLNSTTKTGDLVIPETVNCYGTAFNVTAIGTAAFSWHSKLTSITIPNSVTLIGDSAFSGCSDLTSITIGNSVAAIGSYAFSNCASLTGIYITDITAWYNIKFSNQLSQPLYHAKKIYVNNQLITELIIPDTVTEIKDYAFSYFTNLTSITIPDSVIDIGKHAFYNCGLTTIAIPNSVTAIGNYAFQDCTNLTSVTIGDSIKSIGDEAFLGCTSLTSVYVKDITTWCNIEFGYQSNPLGYANLYANNQLIADNLIIPDTVTEIKKYAFTNYKNLTSVIIPNSVKSIGNDSFMYCSNLTSVTIPNSVTSIGSRVFYECPIEKATMPALAIDSIPPYKLKEVVINGGESIGAYAFQGNDSLISVTISNSVKSIDSLAFELCSNLTSISIPNSVTSIGARAFNGCTSLSNIIIPDSVTEIGRAAFYNCGLTAIVIPNSVTAIGEEAFKYCTSLTSVTIGNSVKSIDAYVFSNCTNLTIIEFKATIAEWNTITKGDFWHNFVPATEVVCKDGTVAL